MILVSELHSCETFWSYAREIRRSGGEESVVREYARRYVPRAGPHNDQGLMAAILQVAAEHHPERYFPWSGGQAQALRRLVELGGPVSYFVDDPIDEGRLYGLPEPSESRRIGTSGRAASVGQLASLERGAELVRRRGAGLCLSPGCEVEVGHDPFISEAGMGRSAIRIDYCQRHEARADHRGDLDAMRGVLIPAAYAYRTRRSLESYSAIAIHQSDPAIVDPRAAGPRFTVRAVPAGAVVRELKVADGELIAEDLSSSIELGLFAEAA